MKIQLFVIFYYSSEIKIILNQGNSNVRDSVTLITPIQRQPPVPGTNNWVYYVIAALLVKLIPLCIRLNIQCFDNLTIKVLNLTMII